MPTNQNRQLLPQKQILNINYGNIDQVIFNYLDIGNYSEDGAFITYDQTSGLLKQTTGLVWDKTTQRLGIGTTSPSRQLDLTGTAKFNEIHLENVGQGNLNETRYIKSRGALTLQGATDTTDTTADELSLKAGNSASSSGKIQFYTADTLRSEILNDGQQKVYKDFTVSNANLNLIGDGTTNGIFKTEHINIGDVGSGNLNETRYIKCRGALSIEGAVDTAGTTSEELILKAGNTSAGGTGKIQFYTADTLRSEILNDGQQKVYKDFTVSNANLILSGDGTTNGKILITHDEAQIVFDNQQQRMITTNDGQGNFAILNNINENGNVVLGNDACTKLSFANDSGDGKILLEVTDNEATGGVTPTFTYSAFLQNSVGFAVENNTLQLMRMNTTGMKIGNGAPSYPLDVTGDINFTGNLRQNGSVYVPNIPTTAGYIPFGNGTTITSDANFVWDNTNQQLSIGSSFDSSSKGLRISKSYAPSTPLEAMITVENKGTTTSSHSVQLIRTSGGTGGDPYLAFDIKNSNGFSMGLDNSDGDKFKFSKNWNFTNGIIMTFNRTTDTVGILTENPSYTLDINGTLRTTGDATVNNLTVNGNVDLTSGELSNINYMKLNNVETSNYVSPVNGLVGYDFNFYASGEAGNPEFVNVTGQAVGGLCIYHDSRWIGLVDSHNMKGLNANFNSVTSATTITSTGTFNTLQPIQINGVDTYFQDHIEFQPSSACYVDFKLTGGNSGYDSRILYNTSGMFIYGSNNRTDIMISKTDGNVGINKTSSASYKLDVNGAIKGIGSSSFSNLDISGNLTKTTTTLVTNLNADLLDGQQGSYYLTRANHTGTLAVSQGGTGATTFTSGRVLIGNGTSSIATDTLQWDTVNNRLGVNTTSPSYTLDVSGDINFTGNITQSGSKIISVDGLNLANKEVGNFTDTAGELGYDTNFHASGEAGVNFVDIGQNIGGLMVRDGDRWTGIVSDNNMKGLNAQFNSITSTTGLNVGIDQNIDFGTIGGGNQNVVGQIRAQGELQIRGATDTGGTTKQSLGLYAGNSSASAGQINFHTADVERMRIHQSGSVQIFNDPCELQLKCLKSAQSNVNTTNLHNITFADETGKYYGRIGTQIQYVSVPLYRSTQFNFYLDDANLSTTDYTTVTKVASINEQGNLYIEGSTAQKSSGTTWTNPSDERIKTDIEPYTTGLEKILQINPVLYNFNGKAKTKPQQNKMVGVIAQQIKEILPQTVSQYYEYLEPEDETPTELYKFDASEITFALINSVKELQSQINILKQQVQELQNQKQ